MRPRSRGTPTAVLVGLGVARQPRVHNDVDPVDVDAASGHIRGDEHAVRTFGEPGERSAAGVLRHAAVQRLGRDTGAGELFGEPVGAALGAGEHQGASGAARQSGHQPGVGGGVGGLERVP